MEYPKFMNVIYEYPKPYTKYHGHVVSEMLSTGAVLQGWQAVSAGIALGKAA